VPRATTTSPKCKTMQHTAKPNKHHVEKSQCSKTIRGGGGCVVSSEDLRSRSQKITNGSAFRYKSLCKLIRSLTESQEYAFITDYRKLVDTLIDFVNELDHSPNDPKTRNYNHKQFTSETVARRRQEATDQLAAYHLAKAKEREDPKIFTDNL